MKLSEEKQAKKRQQRHKRVRAKIFGTSGQPRLSVFRSSKHIFLQLIDDKKNKTLVSASDRELKLKNAKNKTALAYKTGELLAKKALEKKIKTAVFDRGGYKYHGRLKAAAEGARKAGLKF